MSRSIGEQSRHWFHISRSSTIHGSCFCRACVMFSRLPNGKLKPLIFSTMSSFVIHMYRMASESSGSSWISWNACSISAKIAIGAILHRRNMSITSGTRNRFSSGKRFKVLNGLYALIPDESSYGSCLHWINFPQRICFSGQYEYQSFGHWIVPREVE